MSCKRNVSGVLTIVTVFAGLLVLASAVSAATIALDGAMASEEFTRQLEMGLEPSLEDLDGNTVYDFKKTGTAASATDGILTLVSDNYYMSGAADQIWAQSGITASGGYTVEAKVKVVSQTQNEGAGWLFAGTPTLDGTFFNFRDDGIGWGETMTATFSATTTDDYHVYRLAAKDGVCALWLDGNLLSDSLTVNAGAVVHELHLGDEGSNWGGEYHVDYLRFTSGAYAPVPEPSSIVVLGSAAIGLLAYAWRRQK